MSDTETTSSPPANEFVADDGGLTLWRAELDGITVQRVFKGVRIEVFRGTDRLGFTLNADQALHISRLLLACAPQEAAE